MQITVDDNTFHKWATDRGYVRLTDISEFAKQYAGLRAEVKEWVDADDAPELTQEFFDRASVYRGGEHISGPRNPALEGNTFTDQVAALENLDDLKPDEPVPTAEEVAIALRAVITAATAAKGSKEEGNAAGLALLRRFGAQGIKSLPEDKRTAFIAAAKEALK